VSITLDGSFGLYANSVVANTGITTSGPFTTASLADSKGDVRLAPQNAQSPSGASYTLVSSDAGKHVYISGTSTGVTVNASVFSVGDMVMVVNSLSSSITITQGTSVTLNLAGTATTGSRTLAQKGVATLLCVAANTFYTSGAGLT
jgi:hypothetical protein